MAYKKNTAQSIFFALVDASDGSAITGASPSGYVSIDQGAQSAVRVVVRVEQSNGDILPIDSYKIDVTA